MKLSQMDGSPPRTEDVTGLVTLTITTYMHSDAPSMEKLDLAIPQSGIIPFSFQLSDKIVGTSSASLNVRVDFLANIFVFSFRHLFSLPPPRRLCSAGHLFVCLQLCVKTTERIFMKILPRMYL